VGVILVWAAEDLAYLRQVKAAGSSSLEQHRGDFYISQALRSDFET